jgi:hypothetical protein
MSARFDDKRAVKDALYQAPVFCSGAFEAAVNHDRYAGELDAVGADIAADKERAYRDASLLPLAIRALTSRQEVTPG